MRLRGKVWPDVSSRWELGRSQKWISKHLQKHVSVSFEFILLDLEGLNCCTVRVALYYCKYIVFHGTLFFSLYYTVLLCFDELKDIVSCCFRCLCSLPAARRRNSPDTLLSSFSCRLWRPPPGAFPCFQSSLRWHPTVWSSLSLHNAKHTVLKMT